MCHSDLSVCAASNLYTRLDVFDADRALWHNAYALYSTPQLVYHLHHY